MLQNQQRMDTTQMKLVPCHVITIIFSNLSSWVWQERAIESSHSNMKDWIWKLGKLTKDDCEQRRLMLGAPWPCKCDQMNKLKGCFYWSVSSGLMPVFRRPRANPGLYFNLVGVTGEGGGRGGGEVYSAKGSAPSCDLLPFYIPLFIEKVTLSYTFNWQMVPLLHT